MMIRRWPGIIICMLCVMMAVSTCCAEIFLDQDPPEDWADKSTLCLTAFGSGVTDSMMLETGGKMMMIDGGVGMWKEKLQKALLKKNPDFRVDVIYNSHPHDDHLEAIYILINRGLTADEFISSFPKEHGLDVQRKAVSALKKRGIPYHQLENGEEMDFGDAHIRFWYWEGGQDANERSSIAYIKFGSTSILLTGDITGTTQHALHKELGAEILDADLMKMPHHGLVPMVTDFLDDVSPSFVFATNWRKSSVLASEQLERRGIPCFYTTRGRIEMITDGEDWYIRQEKDKF